MFNSINWKDIEVEINNLSKLTKVNLSELNDEYILLAHYGKYTISLNYDNLNEELILLMVLNKDWENPFMERRIQNLEYLKKMINEFIEYITL
jgi:hypothetical protein